MTESVPSGRSFLDPTKILERGGVSAGMHVGDFGVGGAAYFGIQAAKMVGAKRLPELTSRSTLQSRLLSSCRHGKFRRS